MEPLAREEYIEQAYLFRGLNNRLDESDPVQVVMKHLRGRDLGDDEAADGDRFYLNGAGSGWSDVDCDAAAGSLFHCLSDLRNGSG